SRFAQAHANQKPHDMKTALITGASSDIGRAIARTLPATKFNLALHYFSNGEKALALQQEFAARQSDCALFCRDLTDPQQARSLIEEVAGRFTSIDVLVNVVGPFVYKHVLDITPDEWAEDLALNLHTCLHQKRKRSVSPKGMSVAPALVASRRA
ncbi:MAG: SDR family NAD(P)-dependent oxidoreductase, partial [Pseudomonadota bacterium]